MQIPSLFTPPPRSQKQWAIALVLTVIWTGILWLVHSLGVFSLLEDPVLDQLEHLPSPEQASSDLALIEIHHIPSDRPWPWPRLDYALILNGLKPQHPQSVVFEMLLHDEDARYTSFDTIFADQVSVLNKVLFSAAALRPDDAAPPPEGIMPLRATGDFHSMAPFGSFFWPVQTFSSLGKVGICNLSSERNHNLRTVELVFRYREQILPSLALWAAGLRLNADMSKATVDLGHEVVLRDAKGAVLRKIPIDEEGRLRLRFRRPEVVVPRIHADDLVLAADQAERNVPTQVDLNPLLHRQVWIGATDRSVVPTITTVNGPLAPVNIQMQATHQILAEDYIHAAPPWICVTLFLLAGMFLSQSFVTFGVRYGLLALAVAALVIIVITALSFRFFNFSLPLVTCLIDVGGLAICGLAARYWETHPDSIPDPQIPLDLRGPRSR